MKVRRLHQMGEIARAAAEFAVEARDAMVCARRAHKAVTGEQMQWWRAQAREAGKRARKAWTELSAAEVTCDRI